ncbi:MAG: SPFH domain-containing protein, partial [Planctomycetota bacterium]|nr:SPFH domain-containing protein [Planctomycetota bacterium]
IITVPMKRTVEVDKAFFPTLRGQGRDGQEQSLEQATNFAAVDSPIRPGKDGSLLLQGGDIAHCQMLAEYSIDDAIAYLDRFTPEQADEVVRMAMERAAVHVAASLDLDEFVDDRDGVSREIRGKAQTTLDEIDSGIRLTSVNVTTRIPPLAVRKAVQGVTAARENAKTALGTARSESTTILDAAAGAAAFDDIVKLIGEYEAEIGRGDLAAADRILTEIGERFERDDVGGDAAATLTKARAYKSMIESGLGTFARRVASLSESYRQNPSQLVRQLWLEAYQEVLSGPEVEILSAPPGLGGLALRMKSSTDVSNARRENALQRRTSEALSETDFSGFQLGSRSMSIDKAGRRLERDAEGGFGRGEAGE